MLFNITIIILSFAVPAAFLFGFRWGFRYGNNGEEAEKVKIGPQKPKKSYAPSEEIKIINRELQNIDNYTGDGKNQVKIK